VEGGHGLEGTLTLTSENPPTWTLEASFTFPTAGYVVGPVEAGPLGSLNRPGSATGPNTAVVIRIPIKTPHPGQAVAEVVTAVPVKEQIEAPKNATFSIVLQPQ